jgi:integrase
MRPVSNTMRRQLGAFHNSPAMSSAVDSVLLSRRLTVRPSRRHPLANLACTTGALAPTERILRGHGYRPGVKRFPALQHRRGDPRQLVDQGDDHDIAMGPAHQPFSRRPDTARRARSRIELVLNAAIAQGLRKATLINPAGSKLIAAAHPSKRKGEQPHYRAVKIDNAQEVFRALKAEEGSAFAAWLFMVLTAARPSEALEARWAEVDFDRRLWTLPPERMKSAKQHVVPLSTAALAVLDRQRRVRSGDAIFPRPVRRTALLRQLRHRAGQGWDRRLHAAWLAKLLS